MTDIQKQQKKLYVIKTKNYEYRFDNVNDFIKKVIVLDKLKINREIKIVKFLNYQDSEKSVFNKWLLNDLKLINLSKFKV